MTFLPSLFKPKKNRKPIQSTDTATSRTSTAAPTSNIIPAPIQSFEGSQEFYGEQENNNGGDSAAIRAAPAQSFRGSQKIYGRMTNNNGVNATNNNENIGNTSGTRVIMVDASAMLGTRMQPQPSTYPTFYVEQPTRKAAIMDTPATPIWVGGAAGINIPVQLDANGSFRM
ncbi:hypothetical protein BDZ97DRAFT_1924891 [Flammula alnicola]|nr:hypothetical protein BDZ97DRAFT_1924891 [Flammula alnicola]